MLIPMAEALDDRQVLGSEWSSQPHTLLLHDVMFPSTAIVSARRFREWVTQSLRRKHLAVNLSDLHRLELLVRVVDNLSGHGASDAIATAPGCTVWNER
jgi:hypothetical protein